MKQLLWCLFAGTRGGQTRGEIMQYLNKTPSNANKVANALSLDYKTVRHHLDILEKNRFIYAINKGTYGAVFFLTPEFEKEEVLFREIMAQFG